MFTNSGKKIMGLVKFIFYANVVVVALVIIGVTIAVGADDGFGGAILMLLAGTVIGAIYLGIVFLSLLCMYAFGELVQNTCDIRKLMRGGTVETGRDSFAEYKSPKSKTVRCSCGAVLRKGEAFCVKCGKRVDGVAGPISSKPDTVPEFEYESTYATPHTGSDKSGFGFGKPNDSDLE